MNILKITKLDKKKLNLSPIKHISKLCQDWHLFERKFPV